MSPADCSEDYALGSSLPPAAAAELYRNIASGAESGMDFTVRWFSEPSANMSTICTTQIIPVELNAYLYDMERNMAAFANELGVASAAANFTAMQQLQGQLPSPLSCGIHLQVRNWLLWCLQAACNRMAAAAVLCIQFQWALVSSICLLLSGSHPCWMAMLNRSSHDTVHAAVILRLEILLAMAPCKMCQYQ